MKRVTSLVYAIVLVSLCNPAKAQNHLVPLRVLQTPTANPFTLHLKSSLAGHKSQVTSVVFSPNGQLLATASSKENSTRLWNTATGELVSVLDGITPVFNPDGRQLLTAHGKDAKLWEAKTGRLKATLIGHEKDITSATFSPDGGKVATGSEDGTVKLWDATNGRAAATLVVWRVKKIPRYRTFSKALQVPVDVYVKFSPDGRRVLTNTYWEGSSAKLWNAETGNMQTELGGHTTKVGYQTETAGVSSAGFSPDGRFIVTESIDMVRLWEAATGQLVGEFKVGFPITGFSPNAKWLGFLRNEKGDGLLNLETLELRPTPGVDTSFLNQQAFSPDSRTYVIGSGYKDYHATLIDVATGRVKAKIPLVAEWGFDLVSDYQKNVDLLSFHPSSQILMGANHNSVRFWDVLTGQLVPEKAEGRDPAAFSPNGKLLVTTGKDKKTTLLWEVTDS